MTSMLASVIATLATGAVAPAAAPIEIDQVTVGPVPVRAYTMRIVANTAATGHAAYVELDRRAGEPVPGRPGVSAFTQSHSILLRRSVTVTLSRDHSAARLRANLGRYGRIDLSVAGARLVRSRGCERQLHRGVAGGAVRIVPGGEYFGTISRDALPATVGEVSACSDGVAAAATSAELSASTPGVRPGSQRRVVAVQAGTTLQVAVTRPGRRVLVQDRIEANAPSRPVLRVSPDLSTATLTATGPFLGGTATFRAHGPQRGDAVRGTLAGDLQADFDSPGPELLTTPALRAAVARTGP